MIKRPKQKIEAFALSVTRFVGSLQSILLHTFLFLMSFLVVWLGVLPFDRMLLVLTTVVSLEAIYLSIFIQMTINMTSVSLEGVEHGIEEIQEDIDEIQEDVGEIQEDVDEIQEDVDELQEDIEEMSEGEKEEETAEVGKEVALREIHDSLAKLALDIKKLQKK